MHCVCQVCRYPQQNPCFSMLGFDIARHGLQWNSFPLQGIHRRARVLIPALHAHLSPYRFWLNSIKTLSRLRSVLALSGFSATLGINHFLSQNPNPALRSAHPVGQSPLCCCMWQAHAEHTRCIRQAHSVGGSALPHFSRASVRRKCRAHMRCHVLSTCIKMLEMLICNASTTAQFHCLCDISHNPCQYAGSAFSGMVQERPLNAEQSFNSSSVKLVSSRTLCCGHVYSLSWVLYWSGLGI